MVYPTTVLDVRKVLRRSFLSRVRVPQDLPPNCMSPVCVLMFGEATMIEQSAIDSTRTHSPLSFDFASLSSSEAAITHRQLLLMPCCCICCSQIADETRLRRNLPRKPVLPSAGTCSLCATYYCCSPICHQIHQSRHRVNCERLQTAREKLLQQESRVRRQQHLFDHCTGALSDDDAVEYMSRQD